jgi:hypothetical protein
MAVLDLTEGNITIEHIEGFLYGIQEVENLILSSQAAVFEYSITEIALKAEQTNLDLVNSGGDLVFEGEIVEYYIAPITATSQSTAAQNRLTISVNVRFYNTKEELKDFDQRFSFYFDYGGSSQLIGSQKEEAISVIFERITQDIFNVSLANW